MYYLCSDNLNEIHALKTDKPFFYRLKKGDSDVYIATFLQYQGMSGKNYFPCLIRRIILNLFDNILFCKKEILCRIKFLSSLIYTFSPTKESVTIACAYLNS